MGALKEQILDTWRIHQRVMLFMLSEIPQEALSATLSTRGGRDIARQLSHMHAVRMSRLESFAKRNKIEPIRFDPKLSPSKAELTEALEQSGRLMEEFIVDSLDKGGDVSNFRRGLVPMIGYFISHEAHHRGSILLTMKYCGHKLPDSLRWGIWDWNKI